MRCPIQETVGRKEKGPEGERPGEPKRNIMKFEILPRTSVG